MYFCIMEVIDRSVAFHTLGCKLNFSESSSLQNMTEEVGMQTVPFSEKADIYVINTCSVTENADKKCRNLIKRALRKNEDARVIVMGCYAQLKPTDISSIPGVDLVLGAAEKFKLLQHLEHLPSKKTEGKALVGNIEEVNSFLTGHSIGERTRAFLKVQDGCDYSCSFCTIPLARGASRSGTIEQIVQKGKEIQADGIREIVLTGVNTGDFGKSIQNDKGEFIRSDETFFQLLQELDHTLLVDRIRISSIEPNLLDDEIIKYVKNSTRTMPHFHIPLQSGSDKMLKKMRRRYLSDLYRQKIQFIKDQMPDACIGVDVIVGFPGESDDHFKETVSFLTALEVSYLHVFTYSERANTSAPEFEGKVPMHIRQERNKILTELSFRKKRAFYEQQLGTRRPVLWEGNEKEGLMYGYTDNYIRVKKAFEPSSVNTIEPIDISTETIALS